jgi:hypothetical protein
MNLANVMQAISDQLDTIAGLECFPYPPLTIPAPPAAIVNFPKVDYGQTYRRGADGYTLPVAIVVGLSSDAKSAATKLSAYMDSAGASSVKAVVEAGTYTAFDSVTVTSAEVDTVNIGGVDYLRANFELDILGTGA